MAEDHTRPDLGQTSSIERLTRVGPDARFGFRLIRLPNMPASLPLSIVVVATLILSLILAQLVRLHCHRRRLALARALVEQSLTQRGLHPTELDGPRDAAMLEDAQRLCGRCDAQPVCMDQGPPAAGSGRPCPNQRLLDALQRWHRPLAMHRLPIDRSRLREGVILHRGTRHGIERDPRSP